MARNFRPTGRSTRLKKTWTGFHTTSVVNMTTTQVSILEANIGEGAPNQTLLRTRGNILIAAEPDAATDFTIVAFGLIVVQSAAANVGGVSVPGPINDIGADWLWHTFVPLDAVTLTAGDPNARSVVHRVEIDAKAMRRVAADESVLLIGEANVAGMASIGVLAGMRTLFGQ